MISYTPFLALIAKIVSSSMQVFGWSATNTEMLILSWSVIWSQNKLYISKEMGKKKNTKNWFEHQRVAGKILQIFVRIFTGVPTLTNAVSGQSQNCSRIWRFLRESGHLNFFRETRDNSGTLQKKKKNKQKKNRDIGLGSTFHYKKPQGLLDDFLFRLIGINTRSKNQVEKKKKKERRH